ncbi:MAG TPA: type II toxin-antitoxin system MqsA family antitoxin [Geobacteraceae bacterium]|nr:type II toxin-antitoxin system MqsA family antitoxin [Geobacteraceae bacterium]
MSTIGECPICGYDKLQKKVITEVFEYKGETLEVPDYTIWECTKCGEEIVDKKTMKESSKLIKDFYRKVDGLLTASDIKRIRKFKLCLTQEKASSLLGGGAKSFARYETSEVIQSESMDNLLRILDKYPYTISALEEKYAISKPVEMTFKSILKPEEKQIKVVNW